MVCSLVRADEYELLPREEVENLKREVERLKKEPFGSLKEGETLLEAINHLNNNIRRLIDIFSKVEADLVKEYNEGNTADDLKTIREQNEEIAQGIVAVADMVKEMKESPESSLTTTTQEPATLRPGPKIPVVRPRSTMGASLPDFDDAPGPMPPPPGPDPDLTTDPYSGPPPGTIEDSAPDTHPAPGTSIPPPQEPGTKKKPFRLFSRK